MTISNGSGQAPGGGKDAAVAGMDDPFDGVETVNEAAFVAREGGFGRGERGLHELFGECVAADEAVHPIARIIGVKGDDAIECLAPNLRLEEQDFRFL